MLLAIDVGNTMTDFGFFGSEGDPLFYRTRSRRDITLQEAKASLTIFIKSIGEKTLPVEGAIIASVVPSLTLIYVALCKELFGVEAKVLGPGLKSGIRIVTDNPKEVGADMIAAAVGAKEEYGDACIICDFGTATKVILLDETGAFAGCTIGAGVGLQAESLSSSAALLPEVSLQIPAKILGKNTNDCMNSALTYGNAFAASALADGIEKEAGYPCKRVLTGGFSSTVAPLLPGYAHDPYLVLKGLASIYRRNAR
ncbi:MAG: type III pantothenate kinase [Bacilli bacterium]|nr:type III pantothenate kinase [Bacilli bacterium]